jgi:hypothetical protein
VSPHYFGRLAVSVGNLRELVPETDYAARTVWQLWQGSLQTNAEWQLMYELKGQ